jgi:predicted Zn-dependent protease
MSGIVPGPARRVGRRVGRGLAVLALLGLTALGATAAGRHLYGQYQFRQAEAALATHQLAVANRHLAGCLARWPRNPPTLLLAARSARQGGDWKEANQFLRAYRQYGGDPSAEEFILESTLLRAQQGEIDAVLTQCQRWVEDRHPASARVLEALAHSYLLLYRVPEAEVTVKIWLDRYPDDPQAHFYHGWVLEHRDAPERAAEEYRHALVMAPARDDIRLRLASSYLGAARPTQALELLGPLSLSHPDHPPTRLYFARALHGVGRVDDARAALDALLADFPYYPPAMTERGRIAVQEGKTDEAEKWLASAVAQAPGDEQAWFLLSQARRRRGLDKEAAEALARSESLQADQRRIREIATRELSRRPNDPALHAEVGGVLLRAGEPQEALRWLKRALEKDPAHRPTHKLLADYYQKIGQIGLASRHRDKAGNASAGGDK